MRARNLPHCKMSDYFAHPEAADGITAEKLKQLDEYLSAFTPLTADGACPRCDMRIGGLVGAILGGFEWGIVHGEGHCTRCGWLMRGYHWPFGSDGDRLDLVLPYHPDSVTDKSTQEQERADET
jgi:hypothetical protein